MAETLRLSSRRGMRTLRGLEVSPAARNGRELRELAARRQVVEVSGPADYFEDRFVTMISQAVTEHLEIVLPLHLDQSDRETVARYRENLARVAAFVDADNCLRVAYRLLTVQFIPGTPLHTRHAILKKWGLERIASSRFKHEQWSVLDPRGRHSGAGLIELATELSALEEVDFAEPNFVSECARSSPPVSSFLPEQWHLPAIGVADAWKITAGSPAIVVAIVDDGVDIEHPNLASRIVHSPDPNEPDDENGRDFTVPYSDPDHFDPRPKQFASPWNWPGTNDIHGTPCAGIVAADGENGVVGAAPRCRLLPVKAVRAGTDMCQDSRVADAMRYAAQFADIVSCSLILRDTNALQSAVQDAAAFRQGRGTAIFCATGNDIYLAAVRHPAKYDETLAIGACTRAGNYAGYSSRGAALDLVAPSHGENEQIFTTDVSQPSRGHNLGGTSPDDSEGLYHPGFGGTSAATPLAAAVGALCLSVDPDLSRDALRQLLRDTADQIGDGYDTAGHSEKFGYGRVNAAAAVDAAASTGVSWLPAGFSYPPHFFAPELPGGALRSAPTKKKRKKKPVNSKSPRTAARRKKRPQR
jgi:subtilisin family serine protease